MTSERGVTVVVLAMRCAAGGGGVRSLSSINSVSIIVDLPSPASPVGGGWVTAEGFRADSMRGP